MKQKKFNVKKKKLLLLWVIMVITTLALGAVIYFPAEKVISNQNKIIELVNDYVAENCQNKTLMDVLDYNIIEGGKDEQRKKQETNG